MAINTKAIKTRIKSVKNTKKITRAMQMIAAVKMRKSVEAAVNTRTYAKLAKKIMVDLGKSLESEHPLAQKRPINKTLMIVITSNRGLCGNYNSAVLKKTSEYLSQNTQKDIEMVAIGKKAAQFAKKKGLKLVEFYEKLNENLKYTDILPISKSAMKSYEDKDYDEVVIVYTNYISGLSQESEVLNLLPITAAQVQDLIDKVSDLDDPQDQDELSLDDDLEYEPTKKEVLEHIIPMLVEVQIYQSLLESAASEHSSRMIAMKNATEAAGDMIEGLTLEFNKGRQSAITSEITEIVSGASAL